MRDFCKKSDMILEKELNPKGMKMNSFLVRYRVGNKNFEEEVFADNEKAVKKIMKEQWNSPRFDIIIDNNINRYDIFRKYCVGKYYVENKDNVRII